MYLRDSICGYDIYEDFINADWVLFRVGDIVCEILRGSKEEVYNKATENNLIIQAIKFLEKAPYHDRKQYMEDYTIGSGVEINDFIIQRETWCWLIWKPTDIGKNPEYKGEPLCKVVPRFTEFDKMNVVLDSQPWTYI